MASNLFENSNLSLSGDAIARRYCTAGTVVCVPISTLGAVNLQLGGGH